mgnify:CR=1 FL=1
MSKSILLTGATGLIGRAIVTKLSSQHKIVAVSRDPARAQRLFSDTPELTCVSLDEIDNLDAYHAVINLAGEPIADKRWTEAQKEKICNSRWEITEKLAKLILQAEQPPIFISGSAVGIYGRQGNTPINETFIDYHQEFSHDVCKKWEDIALQANNTRVCILRTGIVLSEHGGALSKMLIPFRLGLGGPIADGKQFMSWIHIEDMVNGILFLLNNQSCNGVYNFTAPNPHTNEYFSLWLARRLQRPCFFRVPAFVLKTLMGESADLVLTGQKVIPQRLLDAGFEFQYPTLIEAFKGLDI